METPRNKPGRRRPSPKPPKRERGHTNITPRHTVLGWKWRANFHHDGVREWGPLRDTQAEAFCDYLAMKERSKAAPAKVQTLKEAADRLIEVCRLKALSPHTIRRDYERRLKLFLEAWNPDTLLHQITPEEVEWFMKVRRENHGVTESTLHHDLAVLHRLFQVSEAENPVKKVDKPKFTPKKWDYFAASEVEEIIRRVRTSHYPSAGKHADIMTMIYYTGLRATECERLLVKDIEIENNRIWVKGKNTPRGLPIANTLKPSLQRLLEDQDNPEAQLIPGGAYTIATIFRRWAKRLGIKKLNARTLRHSFATALFERRNPAHVVQQLMGHRNLTTTQKYLHVRDEALKFAVDGL